MNSIIKQGLKQLKGQSFKNSAWTNACFADWLSRKLEAQEAKTQREAWEKKFNTN